jgi:ribonuclease R
MNYADDDTIDGGNTDPAYNVTARTDDTDIGSRVVRALANSPVPLTKKELAKRLSLSGAAKIALKSELKQLERDGAIEQVGARRFGLPMSLPSVAVLRVRGPDSDGDLFAVPENARPDQDSPVIRFIGKGQEALKLDTRVLSRLARQANGSYEARILRVLHPHSPPRVIAIFSRGSDGYGSLKPTDRRLRDPLRVGHGEEKDATPGDVVEATVLPGQSHGLRQARVLRVLGRLEDPKLASLLAAHEQQLPMVFDPAVIAEATALTGLPLGERTDLRHLPLVTIDGADARDFDDAVYANPFEDGWHLIVAIADVSHYVRPGSAIDKAAVERGNSCYFPDRVIPMLPGALSNELCSLVPHQDRACLVAHLWLDEYGSLKRHRFERALIKSHARLIYEDVQAARDGTGPTLPDDITVAVTNLYGAFAVLSAARDRRGTLDLAIPEREIRLGAAGTVETVNNRERLDSHRLIEEFMITANVAAAAALEQRHAPCVYRVHPAPAEDRLETLQQVLSAMGLKLGKGSITPGALDQLLRQLQDHPEAPLVSELVLRAQSQASYATENQGHFGLALVRYAHFTSPIRRYADLLVHRALVDACRLGDGGLDDDQRRRLAAIAAHISNTERRGIAAERSAADRYLSAYLITRVGSEFSARIHGVGRAGLFIRMLDVSADALVPMKSLPTDYYIVDETHAALVGRRWGKVYRQGAVLRVRLVEADRVSGSNICAVVGQDDADLPFAPMSPKARKDAANGADGSRGGRNHARGRHGGGRRYGHGRGGPRRR